MEIKIDCDNAEHRFFMLALMPHILEQLKLTNCNKVLYIVVEKQESEAEFADVAGAMDTGFGYVVTLSSELHVKDLAVTLCHEMVHVKQMITGKLKGNRWCGVDHSTTPYEYQPWEVQAFQMQELIYLRAFTKL